MPCDSQGISIIDPVTFSLLSLDNILFLEPSSLQKHPESHESLLYQRNDRQAYFFWNDMLNFYVLGAYGPVYIFSKGKIYTFLSTHLIDIGQINDKINDVEEFKMFYFKL